MMKSHGWQGLDRLVSARTSLSDSLLHLITERVLPHPIDRGDLDSIFEPCGLHGFDVSF
jgi:hypothetical protein